MTMRRSTIVRNVQIIKKLDAGLTPKEIVTDLNLMSVNVVYNANRPGSRRLVKAAMRKRGRR